MKRTREDGLPLRSDAGLRWLLLAAYLTAVNTGCSSPDNSPPMFAADEAVLKVGGKFDATALGQNHSAACDILDSALAEQKPVVVCFLASNCAASQGMMPRIAAFQQKRQEIVLQAFLVAEPSELESFIQQYSIGFPLASDFDLKLSKALGADRTPMFFVFDAQRTLVYSGPFDDSTLLAAQVKERLVEAAVNAVLNSSAPPQSRAAVGRPILGSD